MRRESAGSGEGWAMEISTYAAFRRGKDKGSWSSGKKDVKDASRGIDHITNTIIKGLGILQNSNLSTFGYSHKHFDGSLCNHRWWVGHCVQGPQVCHTLYIRRPIFTLDLETKHPIFLTSALYFPLH